MTDPLGDLLARARTKARGRLGAAVAIACASHASVGVAVASKHGGASRDTAPVQEVSAVFEDPPPPAPAPEDEARPLQIAAPSPAVAKSHVSGARSAAPPAAAGAVLTANDDAPADFTGDVVVGSAETYAGGATSPVGTGAHRGSAAAAADATPAPTAAPPSPDTPNQSRLPRLAGGASWSCPFPVEADGRGIDDAVVRLRVEVGADGRVVRAVVISDPGSGFGREAAACARSKRFDAARDRQGRPVAGQALVSVRFHR